MPLLDPQGPPPSRFRGLERNLGYVFRDQTLLKRALTHRSGGAENLERFEFLGDAALGYLIGRVLFDAMPDATEHRLTLMRASLVRRSSLAALAGNLELGKYLLLGTAERKSGVAKRASVLADALEAVLGAIVCDGGIDSADAVARRIFAAPLASIDHDELKDPKTKLQEYLQSRHLEPPDYAVVDTAGPHHERLHTMVCQVDGLGLKGEGTGRSRREAEKSAAAVVLAQLPP